MSDSESQNSANTYNKGKSTANGKFKGENPFDNPPRTAASSRDGDSNPFVIPEEKLCEMIFTFKDDEK
jgi:hypothetical protein